MLRAFGTVLAFLVLVINVQAQNTLNWSENYTLKFSDFRSPASKIGGEMYSLYNSASMDFSFYMSNYEFMFTKNFNSKVNCTFTRDASSLVAPNEEYVQYLLNFAQFGFDLSELYARKFRKELYENKGVFSDIRFFEPIYNKIQKDYSKRYTEAADACELGKNEAKLLELHLAVKNEINELSDFCKSCKPPKKKKEKS